MATVEASMRIDDEGTVQTLEMAGNEFKEVSESADQASDSLIDYEKAQKRLEDGAFDMQEAIIQTHDNIDDLRGKLGAIDQVAQSTGASFEQLVTEVDFGNFGESIRELRDDLESGERQANELRNAFEQLESAQKDAGSSADELAGFQAEVVDKNSEAVQQIEENAQETKNLSNQYFDASEAAERYQESLTVTSNRTEQLENSIRDQVQTLEIAEERMAAMRLRQEQVTQGTRNWMGTTRGANEILFSTGDLIQDLQFGIRGAGNNIAFLAENFIQTTERAGGFNSALNEIFTALKGPGGIIIGLQALLALSPTISSFFQEREEEAEGYRKELEEAAQSLLGFQEDIAGFEFGSVEEARRVQRLVEQRVETQQEEVRMLEEAINTSNAYRDSYDEVGRVIDDINDSIEGQLSLSGVGIRNAKQLRDILEGRRNERQDLIDELKATVNLTEEEIKNRERLRSIERILADFGIERAENQEEANDAAREGLGIASDIVEEQNKIVREEDIDFKGFFETVVKDIQDAEEWVDRFGGSFSQSINDVNSLIEVLEGKFNAATGQDQRDRIRRLIEELRDLKEEMKGVEEVTRTLDTTFSDFEQKQLAVQSLTTAFSGLAEGIGAAMVTSKSMGEVVKGVLASIGRQIGQQLIAMGSAMIIGSLFGPAQKAGQGAALVGIGTALVGSSAALSASINEGGARRTRQGQQIERGGTVGSEVNAPGRQQGGPVQRGSLYRTHGLGEREFFIPNFNGQIMTERQLASATSRQSVNVNNNVRSRIAVEDAEMDFDIAQVRARLNEVETKIDKVS